MKYEIKNRFTGEVQFTADINCSEDESISVKIGLAVKLAVKTGANLADAYLADANLTGAYLTGANLAGAYLAGANLADAYLTGANLAGANLADANLTGANLAGANLADANLTGANLADAYLAGANLTGANLAGAYLTGANLAGANLTGANLARALKIDPAEIPSIPNIDAVILAEIEKGGVLEMSSWHGPLKHWCGTTHCRAGWAIHCAGKAGKALQDKVGPQMAGTLIYHASRPGVHVPHFFASYEDALADIRKCATEQERGND